MSEMLFPTEIDEYDEKDDAIADAIFDGFPTAWDEVAERVHGITVQKGFWDMGVENRNKPEMIALMHSELSEALEALRKHLMDDKLPQYDGVTVELADTIIRIMDYGYAFGLDIGNAVLDKIAYNAGREYKHGKAF